MDLQREKQVADPVHNTLGLTETEVKIIETPAFQRLRRVMQLGMVDRVFPGANYSRFSHSLGVCHVAGRIMQSLKDSGADFGNEMIQRYRLAGLLHDIGHYPFSHTMEDAIENAELPGPTREHEEVGRLVVENDSQISEILQDDGFDPEVIADIFCRSADEEEEVEDDRLRYVDVISSGLDADRLDYLRRSAHHSGVPYGSVNFDYLISQFELDEANSNVCLSERALNAADHFLMSRWFEYQQLIFHHTVQAASVTLRNVLEHLVQDDSRELENMEPGECLIEANDMRPHFACVESEVKSMITNEVWEEFDDTFVEEEIRKLSDSEDGVIERKCEAILKRKFPKTVYEYSYFRPSDIQDVSDPAQEVRKWCQDESLEDGYGIGQEYWEWHTLDESITGIEARKEEESRRTDHHKYPLRVQKSGEDEAHLITDFNHSICSLHAGKRRVIERLFVMFPTKQSEIDKREQIESEIGEVADSVDESSSELVSEASEESE